ncbi:MAG: T9SS type A sorting domain-containing protein [Bacteroidia bacterium]
MLRLCIATLLLGFIPVSNIAQVMNTERSRDLTIPYIELNPSYYNFDYPINSDALASSNFSPPDSGVYLLASYGHRYLSSRTTKTDNHGGLDFWYKHTYRGVVYDQVNLVPILCMCDGVISTIINGPDSVLEQTAGGRSVQVLCDSQFQAFNSDLKINYRHLSSIGTIPASAEMAPANSVRVSKGDTMGLVGESGTTTNKHLHLSVQTSNHPDFNLAFVNTWRLFDPTLHPQILSTLRHARVEVLRDWPDSTLFRIIWPYNQSINRFEFSNQTFSLLFDKETAYETSANRDAHDCQPGVKVFAYQFNGSATAKRRYTLEMPNMPAVYPASPQRDNNLAMYGYQHFPIEHDSVSFVYDFMIENVPSNHAKDDWKVKLSDVWGYTVEASFDPVSSIEVPQHPATTVYPNPVADQLHIHLDLGSGFTELALYDRIGNIVLRKESHQTETVLNLKALPPGVYLLRVGNSVHKVLKK